MKQVYKYNSLVALVFDYPMETLRGYLEFWIYLTFNLLIVLAELRKYLSKKWIKK